MWWPSPNVRAASRNRVAAFEPAQFEKYSDYFFFIHIDPILRFWHALGMIAGIGFFVLLLFNWTNWYWNVVYYVLGVFFFYIVGIISHHVYDGGGAKTERKQFFDSFPTVIYINLLTATGLYQSRLRRFVEKYPFTIEAYALVPRSELASRRARLESAKEQ